MHSPFIVSVFISTIGCHSNNKANDECLKYMDEKYEEQKTDSTSLLECYKYHENLLARFNEKPIKGLEFEAYHFLYHSSFGYGKSIKLEKSIHSWSLSVKCFSPKDAPEECKEYHIKINKDEWFLLKIAINFLYSSSIKLKLCVL